MLYFSLKNNLKYKLECYKKMVYFRLMKKLKIKTSCGIEKYNKLRMNKSFIGKVRFYWFTIFAVLRDLNK